MIFTSSVLPLSVTTRLGMTWSCIFDRNRIWNKETDRLNKILFMRKNFLTSRLSVGCNGSYTKDEPKFPMRNTDNLISQKTVWRNKVLNFEGFSRPSEEIQYFSRILSQFKDFLRWQLKCKTFSSFYKSCMNAANLTQGLKIGRIWLSGSSTAAY